MAGTDPMAFLSYVRADDEHDRGRITALRARLEGEVRMHTGRPFAIFQDKRDLKWGQQWKERLDSTLLNVTFLIPVMTPSYFRSNACREEFEKFLLREKQLGENRLILPIYYLEADEINDAQGDRGDAMARALASRNWADWRKLRFKELTSAEVESAISDMAVTVKNAMKELEGIIAASDSVRPRPPLPTDKPVDLSKFSPITPTVRGRRHRARPHAESLLYYAYTTEYDEEVFAANLSEASELERLQKSLHLQMRRLEATFRVQIRESTDSLAKVRAATPTSVTLLVDNSGSMRGMKIVAAASWAYVVSRILEKFGFQTEVLGFTTRTWKGGQSRERWLQDGKPASPGRLNDLRHIIYKDFASTTEASAPNFGLMVREGLLKENIDGEALLWAHDRAVEHGSDRKVIVVISDGAPVDDSTLSVNDAGFLDRHLRATAQWLTQNSRVGLFGVGLEFDCSRYYSTGFTVADARTLGVELLDALPQWLGAAAE